MTAGTTFGDVRREAFGGVANYVSGFPAASSSGISVSREGAAGTVYLQKAGQERNEGTLILDNGPLYGFFPAVTTLPAAQLYDDPFDLEAFEKIIVRNEAILFARPDVTLDLTAVNINPEGWTNGWIAVMQTNNIVFPENDFTLEHYNLVFGTNWVYDGNLVLATNTVISHFGSKDDVPEYHLDMTVTGNLTIEDGARIDVSFRGFLQGMGPGAAVTAPAEERRGGSHGGRGAGIDPDYFSDTYGSFLEPMTLGSGGQGQWNHGNDLGFYRGGGAARIAVGGLTQVDGNILARGGNMSNWSVPASGGSIWLTTGSLSGDGNIDVRGGRHVNSAGHHGGGGRIAVYLTDSQSFGDVELLAHGWRDGRSRTSGAGTIYRERLDSGGNPIGELLIDNAGKTVVPDWVYTPIPADLEAPELASPWLGASHVTLVVTNRAQVALTRDMRMLDLYLRNDVDPTRLYLQGHTLTLRMPYHADWGHEDWVVYDGGEIVWTPRGTVFYLR